MEQLGLQLALGYGRVPGGGLSHMVSPCQPLIVNGEPKEEKVSGQSDMPPREAAGRGYICGGRGTRAWHAVGGPDSLASSLPPAWTLQPPGAHLPQGLRETV